MMTMSNRSAPRRQVLLMSPLRPDETSVAPAKTCGTGVSPVRARASRPGDSVSGWHTGKAAISTLHFPSSTRREATWRLDRAIIALLQMLGLALVPVMFTALAGCNDDPPVTDDSFRMAVLAPGSTGDQGWNQAAKEATEELAKILQMDPKPSFVENVSASEQKSHLREFGRNGYNLVICHGYEFHQAAEEVAAEFPDTLYFVSGYDKAGEHISALYYDLAQATYICGAIAAKASETGAVGFIAAQETPTVVQCFKGFRNGFLTHRPDGTVRDPVYIEGPKPWEDAAAAKVKTQAMLQVTDPAPIDFLFQNTDAASRGVFEAVEEHDGRIFAFGCNSNQNDTTATSKVIASVVIDLVMAFSDAHAIAVDAKYNEYKPRVIKSDMTRGRVDVKLNPNIDDMLGEELRDEVYRLHSDLELKASQGDLDPLTEPVQVD